MRERVAAGGLGMGMEQKEKKRRVEQGDLRRRVDDAAAAAPPAPPNPPNPNPNPPNPNPKPIATPIFFSSCLG
ncbi:LOW QUALITY PROTEIN: hypothetical protein TorRG33x02_113050 [Trema orientale]|uniref:Uncharacterized protein n=1 Tax=Trema orientale TaxID=63057 RepID=A0A2P5F5F7_TREOI|nr:LOW QUALITY PROTEIN: hypothetical protein TorRG33x02_113050 [Trema orientale]